MGFRGFSPELLAFLNQLENNNTKEWFEAHKSDYQRYFIDAALDFCVDIAPELQKLSPHIEVQPKLNGSLRRIFRDTRFSKDKTPYHTHMHLIFWAGEHPNRAPGLHLVLAKNRFGFGVGHWGFTPDQLARYRAYIGDEGGAELTKIHANLKNSGLALDPPQLKRVPKNFEADGPDSAWLKHKGIVMRNDITPMPDALLGADATSFCLEKCALMLPLLEWLHNHIYTQT